MHKYYKIRFHLGSGKYYKFWQIKNKNDKVIEYCDPSKVQLILHNCELINKKTKASKVLKTQIRDVCGWIKCENYEVVEKKENNNLKMIIYDPKIMDYWHFENNHDNIDGTKFNEIITIGKRAYCEN